MFMTIEEVKDYIFEHLILAGLAPLEEDLTIIADIVKDLILDYGLLDKEDIQ